MTTSDDPFLEALRKHHVSAQVMHADHYRVKRGVAVRTDYIVMIQPKDSGEIVLTGDEFDPFMISKTYKAFRAFVEELKRVCDSAVVGGSQKTFTPTANGLLKYVEMVAQLIDTQQKQYLGTMSYSHVKSLAKQRTNVLNAVLEVTCQHFPCREAKDLSNSSDIFIHQVTKAIQTFFLTDHCMLDEINKGDDPNFLGDRASETAESMKNPILNPLAGLLNILDKKDKPATGGNDTKATPGKDDAARSAATPSIGDPALHLEPTQQTAENKTQVTQVVPLTRRERRSVLMRAHDAIELQNSGNETNFELDDNSLDEMDAMGSTTTTITTSQPTLLGTVAALWHNNSQKPWFRVALVGTALVLLSRAAEIRIYLDADWGLLLLFAAYCLGLHTPREVPKTTTKATRPILPDRSGRKLLRRTMMSSSPKLEVVGSRTQIVDVSGPATAAYESSLGFEYGDDLTEDQPLEDEEAPGTAMSEFPEGAELGSLTNCWGKSKAADFMIRGTNYLQDKKKIPSNDFLFQMRGAELFLTDTCPENVGNNSGMLNGRVRELPTFLINFRLPWGILVLYYEIPQKFIPYLRACYEKDGIDKSKLQDDMKNMTPGERCACRFLMNDDSYKNKCFKIVPVVVKGPWVVRQVVGGKPALIGNKLPIDYVYQPPEDGKALYLEADLDIAASSAARGILSVTRAYTQILTLDLGFVVQGNLQDELPEQMLVGCRLHGVDPLTALSYPALTTADEENRRDILLTEASAVTATSSDDDSVTPMSVSREQ